VLHTASAKARTADVIKMHNIPSAMSDDLKGCTATQSFVAVNSTPYIRS